VPVGHESFVLDVSPMKTDSDFVCTLQDVTRKRGAMGKPVSDSPAVEASQRVNDLMDCIAEDTTEDEVWKFRRRPYCAVLYFPCPTCAVVESQKIQGFSEKMLN